MLGVVGGFAVVVRFQKIMTALDDVRQVWPRAAEALEVRYRKIDLALESVDANDVAPTAVEPSEWRRARTAFRASTQYDVQARSVERLEDMAYRLASAADEATSTDTPESIREFIRADRVLESLQSDGLGWICTQLFRMNIPSRIYSFLE